MPTYKFTITMPVDSTLPRDRISNTIHMDHVNVMQGTDLEAICDDLVAMYAARYHNASKEIKATAYDTDAVPNYPRASSIMNEGQVWTHANPSEVALCLSFCGSNGPRPRERGRIYLMPGLDPINTITAARPNPTTQQWALDFFSVSNESFPDIGGIDWKFGIWSHVDQKFTQAQRAWVDDEWDTVRRRGKRATTRLESVREG